MTKNVIRFVTGVIGFLVMGFSVTIVCGMATHVLFPTNSTGIIDFNLRSLPAIFLGLLAGLHTFRASMVVQKYEFKPTAIILIMIGLVSIAFGLFRWDLFGHTESFFVTLSAGTISASVGAFLLTKRST